MKSTYVHVEVERGENERIATTVLAHEIPCLQAKHGEGSIHIVKEVPKDILDYGRIGQEVELDREEEWGRLISKYGMHPTHDMETVVFVFQNNRKQMANFDFDDFVMDMEGDLNNEGVSDMLDMLEDMDIDVENEQPAKVERLLRKVLTEKLEEQNVAFDANADIKVLMAVSNAVLNMSVADTIINKVKSAVGGTKNTNVDEDGDGNITNVELRVKLDTLQVSYKANDTKPVLMDLLSEELKTRLEEYEVEFDEEEAVEVLWSKVEDHENSVKVGETN